MVKECTSFSSAWACHSATMPSPPAVSHVRVLGPTMRHKWRLGGRKDALLFRGFPSIAEFSASKQLLACNTYSSYGHPHHRGLHSVPPSKQAITPRNEQTIHSKRTRDFGPRVMARRNRMSGDVQGVRAIRVSAHRNRQWRASRPHREVRGRRRSAHFQNPQ